MRDNDAKTIIAEIAVERAELWRKNRELDAQLDLERALVAAFKAERDEAVEALDRLRNAAAKVAEYGAKTGPQWSTLSIALINARATFTKLEKSNASN